MLSKIIIIIVILAWLYLLSVLKRAKTAAFYFITGAAGLFLIIILLSKPYGIWLISTMITWVVGVLGHITGLFNTFYMSHVIQVVTKNSTNIFLVDFECSGIIESAAYIGLIAFYPVYTLQQRLKFGVIGLVTIFGANVLRLTFVAIVIYYFGSQAFYLAHSILGRLIFYVIIITLYYLVFTKAQLLRRNKVEHV